MFPARKVEKSQYKIVIPTPKGLVKQQSQRPGVAIIHKRGANFPP